MTTDPRHAEGADLPSAAGSPGVARLSLRREVVAEHAGQAGPTAATALPDSEQLLELFFTQSLDGFFFMLLDEPVRWDPSTDKDVMLDYVFEHQRITRVNGAMLAQYGAPAQQFLGQTPARLFAHDIPLGRRLWRQLFDAGRLHVETDERRFDGTPIVIEGDYICLYTADGRILGHFGIQRDITERRHADEALRRSREELRALAARLQSVREEERTRISREIHDELGQALTGLKLDLAWLRPRLKDRPELTERLQSVVARIDGTIDSVRRIATELRPSVLDHLGLVAAVEWQAQEFSKRTGIAAAIRLAASTAMPAADTATTVFRILQEALTNVARHAQATRVEIALDLTSEAVRLDVHDNGRGIDAGARAGARSLGLLGMQERASACGGELTIDSRPGTGTVLSLLIPGRAGTEPAP